MYFLRFCCLIIVITLLLSTGCRTTPFNIKSRVDVPVESIANSTSATELELRAQLLPEDESIATFDGSLLLSGVIPVRIALTNRSQQPVNLATNRFQLFDVRKRSYSPLKANDALKRMVKYYGVRAYNPIFFDEMKEKFFSHSIVIPTTLAAGETVQGLLYFKQDKEQPVPTGLRLEFGKQQSPYYLTIALN